MVLPGGDAPAQAVMTLAGQVDDIGRADAVPAPVGHAACHPQAPVQDDEGLAATGWAVDHDQTLILYPALDEP